MSLNCRAAFALLFVGLVFEGRLAAALECDPSICQGTHARSRGLTSSVVIALWHLLAM